MSCARETTLTLFIMYLCPLKLTFFAGYISHTVLDNLMIFGGLIAGQVEVPHARRTTLALFFFSS